MYSLIEWLSRIASRRVVIALIIACIVCGALFEVRHATLGYENRPPDLRLFGYNARDLSAFLTNIGPDGRRLYGITQFSLDALFPLIYGAALGIWLSRLYPTKTAALLMWPLAIALLGDLFVENAITGWLALSDQLEPSSYAPTASVATTLKWCCLMVVGVGIAVGIVNKRGLQKSL